MNKSKLKKKYKKFRSALTVSIVNHIKYNYSIKIPLDELLKNSQSNLDLVKDKLKIKKG